jgi:hypothetical protein
MELELLLDAIKGAQELAEYARTDESVRRDSRRTREIQKLIEALRLIYFSPGGVIALLDQIADGKEPSEDQIATILPDFNDYEFRVLRMLGRISPEEGSVQGRLTLRAERVLREISYGKKGVRGKVKDLLNKALTYGHRVSRADAASLRDEIVVLNNTIEAAEIALVEAMR